MPLTSGINHVTVPTPDLDRLADFYARMFEAPTVFEAPAAAGHPRMAIVELGGDRYVKLVEESDVPRRAATRVEHFGLAVASRESLEALRRRMREAGADVGEIERLPTQWVMWVRDPDGTEFQVCAHRAGRPAAPDPVRSAPVAVDPDRNSNLCDANRVDLGPAGRAGLRPERS